MPTLSAIPAPRRQPAAWMLAPALAIALVSGLAAGAAPVRFEREQDRATRLLVGPQQALSGVGYRLPATTPVQNFMGRFRVETDVGTIEAVGREELAERIAELPAVRRLQALERSDVFAQALATSARSTADGVVRVITEPVETIFALPAGIGRALASAGHRVRDVAVSIGDASQRATPAAAAPVEESNPGVSALDPAFDFAQETAGVNRARRAIASDLGIDPYTRNPLLADRLQELAWASVAGAVSMDVALAAVPRGAREGLGAAGQIDQLAWDLPPADIRRQLERRLRDRGHAGFEAREFLRNGAFSPTDQLRFVESMERIDAAEGEQALLALGSRMASPRRARFLLRQLDLLAAADRGNPVRELSAEEGFVWAIAADGTPVLPLPVDHVSWTEAFATVLPQPASKQQGQGRILLTGTATSLARSQLSRVGWRIEAVD